MASLIASCVGSLRGGFCARRRRACPFSRTRRGGRPRPREGASANHRRTSLPGRMQGSELRETIERRAASEKPRRAPTINGFAKLGTALGGTPTIVERLPTPHNDNSAACWERSDHLLSGA